MSVGQSGKRWEDRNVVMIEGRATRDAEVRYTPKGGAVAEFGVASNRRFQVDGKDVDDATFVTVVIFGKQAEASDKEVKKGTPVMVFGRLKFESWEAKGTGERRSTLKIVASAVYKRIGMHDQPTPPGGRGGERSEPEGGDRGEGKGEPDLENDDIPF